MKQLINRLRAYVKHRRDMKAMTQRADELNGRLLGLAYIWGAYQAYFRRQNKLHHASVCQHAINQTLSISIHLNQAYSSLNSDHGHQVIDRCEERLNNLDEYTDQVIVDSGKHLFELYSS